MKDDSYREVAEAPNPCIADAPEPDAWDRECAARDEAQLLDAALEAAEGKRTWITGTQHVLAAEVKRLRAENEHLSTFGPLRRLNDEWTAHEAKLVAEAERLRGSYEAAKWDRECLQKRRDELEAKLSTIEALLVTERGYTLADKIKEVLRDGSAPEREPPLPYNGY